MSSLISDSVEQFINAHLVARLATAGNDKQPHLIPFCYAYDGRHFYFVVDQKPKRQTGKPLKRIQNMLENPQVALVIDDYSDDWSQLAYVMVRGTSALVEDEAEYDRSLALTPRAISAVSEMELIFGHNSMVRITPKKVNAWGKVGE